MKQITALKILQEGHNVFLTGSAGAGKSYTLRRFIEHLHKNKINVDLIDNLDQMLHDIDYFENGSFKLNEIEKLFLV